MPASQPFHAARHSKPESLEEIVDLFERHGHVVYEGRRAEPVTALEHALQCAQLAEWASAPDSLVIAALLHDVGHFFEPASGREGIDDLHELRALGLLSRTLGPDVAEPVRLHVQAKRYLVAVDGQYAGELSPASVHTLALQGGPMTAVERAEFDVQPFAAQALALRRWDDQAKLPNRPTSRLDYYLALADQVARAAGACDRAALSPAAAV